MPPVPATQEAEIRMIMVPGLLEQKKFMKPIPPSISMKNTCAYWHTSIPPNDGGKCKIGQPGQNIDPVYKMTREEKG
jgi:hypothetical protein